jgi:hypothetical protein
LVGPHITIAHGIFTLGAWTDGLHFGTFGVSIGIGTDESAHGHDAGSSSTQIPAMHVENGTQSDLMTHGAPIDVQDRHENPKPE